MVICTSSDKRAPFKRLIITISSSLKANKTRVDMDSARFEILSDVTVERIDYSSSRVEG